MALGDNSNPTRFLKGQTAGATLAEQRTLALDVFGGEVFTAFDSSTVFADKVQNRTLGKGAGRSARFPKVWKALAEYHKAGQEMLGNAIETGEIAITVDEILVAHTAIYDLDEVLTHFDVRSQFTSELGRALAKIYDQNIARSLILAARTAGVGPFPGGSVVTDAALTNSGVIDGAAWIDGIRHANGLLYDKDVPEDMPRFLAVNRPVFEAIKYAKDSNGNYLVLNRDFGHSGAGGLENRAETMSIDGVTIIKSRHLPKTDESADASVYTKYRANYANTTGVLWTPMAAASVKLMDITLETERDVRRQEDFMVSKMLAGHGTLRPECAVEFKIA